jgi:uncharacterized membrane protein
MNAMTLLIPLHLLAAVIWVGGMFFAHRALRPVAATLLEPPQRLPLWTQTFLRFFPWVWLAVVLLPATGYAMVFAVFGGMANVGLHVHIMQGLGWLMILLYLHMFFAPFQRLKRAVAIGDWQTGAAQLAQIRRIVGINLILGLIVTVVASGGRYL